jgi:hypothetical protein
MRFLLFTFLVCCLALLAAWHFNWITLTVAKGPDGSVSDVNVKVNRGKVKEDVNRGRTVAREAAEEVADAVKEDKKRPKEETVRGIVRDVKSDQVTLDVAGKTMTFKVTGDTKIKLEGRVGTTTDLRPGQEASLSYIERGGDRVSQEITVLAEKK